MLILVSSPLMKSVESKFANQLLCIHNRFDPECEPHLDEVQSRQHSLLVKYVITATLLHVLYS